MPLTVIAQPTGDGHRHSSTQIMARNYEQLHYQPGTERKYRVTWYGGSSNQLHFQKWGIVATPEFSREPEWIDIDCRTMMEFPTRVKELWEEMRDYYNYGIEMEQERTACFF